jgi:hypothetical protein
MELSEDQIRKTFAQLRSAGIAARAIVYLGGPYESEASLEETRQLLLDLRPAGADVRAYYPWPGTRASELARDNGWLHTRGEDQLHEERCGLDMPACRAAVVDAFRRKLVLELPVSEGAPWWRRFRSASRFVLAKFWPDRR